MSSKDSQPSNWVILRPTRGLAALNLRDLWVYRELLVFLTWRDIAVRYKQTMLGVLWAVLQPLLQMLIFTFVFNGIAKIDAASGVPYPIFSYTGLLPWGLFSKALSDAGRSLVANRNMITKIYFPRLIIPLASVLGGVVDFFIAALVLVGLMTYYNQQGLYTVEFTAALWLMPLFLLLAIVTALGVGLWLSALNVQYRDVGYVLPFLTQFWMYLTPVIYPIREIPAAWQWLYSLNPMVGVVEGFRWTVLGQQPPGSALLISSLAAVAVLISGVFYFRHMERTFADTI